MCEKSICLIILIMKISLNVIIAQITTTFIIPTILSHANGWLSPAQTCFNVQKVQSVHWFELQSNFLLDLRAAKIILKIFYLLF